MPHICKATPKCLQYLDACGPVYRDEVMERMDRDRQVGHILVPRPHVLEGRSLRLVTAVRVTAF